MFDNSTLKMNEYVSNRGEYFKIPTLNLYIIIFYHVLDCAPCGYFDFVYFLKRYTKLTEAEIKEYANKVYRKFPFHADGIYFNWNEAFSIRDAFETIVRMVHYAFGGTFNKDVFQQAFKDMMLRRGTRNQLKNQFTNL